MGYEASRLWLRYMGNGLSRLPSPPLPKLSHMACPSILIVVVLYFVSQMTIRSKQCTHLHLVCQQSLGKSTHTLTTRARAKKPALPRSRSHDRLRSV